MIAVPLFGLILAAQAAGGGFLSDDALLESGRYFEYVRTVEHELLKSPSNAGLHASLALGYYLLGQERFCDEEIRRAAALLETNGDAGGAASVVEARYLIGRIAMERSRFQEAAGQFQTALRLQPSNAKVEYFLGASLRALGRDQEAESHLEHSCRAGTLSWPCAALARMELDRGNPAAAMKHAKLAIGMDPRSAQAQLTAGKAAAKSGESEAAVSFFHRAAELDPTWADPHYALGRLYEKTPGKRDEAARELAQFRELLDEGR